MQNVNFRTRKHTCIYNTHIYRSRVGEGEEGRRRGGGGGGVDGAREREIENLVVIIIH